MFPLAVCRKCFDSLSAIDELEMEQFANLTAPICGICGEDDENCVFVRSDAAIRKITHLLREHQKVIEAISLAKQLTSSDGVSIQKCLGSSAAGEDKIFNAGRYHILKWTQSKREPALMTSMKSLDEMIDIMKQMLTERQQLADTTPTEGKS